MAACCNAAQASGCPARVVENEPLIPSSPPRKPDTAQPCRTGPAFIFRAFGRYPSSSPVPRVRCSGTSPARPDENFRAFWTGNDHNQRACQWSKRMESVTGRLQGFRENHTLTKGLIYRCGPAPQLPAGGRHCGPLGTAFCAYSGLPYARTFGQRETAHSLVKLRRSGLTFSSARQVDPEDLREACIDVLISCKDAICNIASHLAACCEMRCAAGLDWLVDSAWHHADHSPRPRNAAALSRRRISGKARNGNARQCAGLQIPGQHAASCTVSCDSSGPGINSSAPARRLLRRSAPRVNSGTR